MADEIPKYRQPAEHKLRVSRSNDWDFIEATYDRLGTKTIRLHIRGDSFVLQDRTMDVAQASELLLHPFLFPGQDA